MPLRERVRADGARISWYVSLQRILNFQTHSIAPVKRHIGSRLTELSSPENISPAHPIKHNGKFPIGSSKPLYGRCTSSAKTYQPPPRKSWSPVCPRFVTDATSKFHFYSLPIDHVTSLKLNFVKEPGCQTVVYATTCWVTKQNN